VSRPGDDVLLVGTRRLRGHPARVHGPWHSRDVAGRDDLLAAVAAALDDRSWVRRGPRVAGFRLTVLDGRTVHELRSGVEQVRDDAPVPALLRLVWHLPDPPLTAAQALAALCDLVVAADPDLAPADLVARLGEQAAGIAPGRAGWGDLLRGGSNRLPGHGFAAPYDDGTPGQVRHFAGTAAACLRLGPRLTRVAAVLTGDLPGSADLRLSEQAVAFTRALTAGDLAPADAADWIRAHLLAR
jgi:hypothetical protein